MARHVLLAALVVVMAATPRHVAAQATHPFDSATINVRSYFDTDGLPQNSVESISLDPEGRLWVTTRDGGAVFDGTTWTAVPIPDPTGANWPRAVVATTDGSVWFSVEPGSLLRLANGAWQAWDGTSGLTGRVNTMLEHDGSLLVGTTEGIYALRLSAPSPAVEVSERNVLAIARGDGDVFALTHDGELLRRLDRAWSAVPDVRATDAGPRSLLVSRGRTFIGTSSGIVMFDLDGTSRTWETGAPVTSIEKTRSADGEEQFWAATEGDGLLHLVDDRWRPVAPQITVPNRFIYDLAAAPADAPTVQLLAGTLSGIARIDLTAWRRIGTSDGLPEASVVSILESRALAPGTYFLGTTGGLARFGESKRWEAAPCELTRRVGVFSMLESAARRVIYVGTDDGVIEMRPDGCSRIDGLGGVSVVAMLEGGTIPGRIWAGTYGEGLWYLDGDGRWAPSTIDLPDNRVEALARSGRNDETLWIATNGGLVRWSEGTRRVFDRESGLPHSLVRSLLIHDGTLWVGTTGGITRTPLDADPPRWSPFDMVGDGRMQNDTVYRIEAGRDGRLYAFTGRGVARLVFDRERGDYRMERVFLSDDGLPSSETNFGASMVDSTGRIWAGTPLGAGIFDPAIEAEQTTQSHRLVVEVKSEPDGETIVNGDVLGSDVDRVVASFRLIDLVHGHRAMYRTELVGLDDQPGHWTPSSQRVFSKLPGGRFDLRVWARDPHGHEAGPVTVSFSVQQPPWLSWWAVLIYVAAAVVILYTFVGLRIRALRRRNQELELLVRSRTRDLEVANRQLESANVTLADMSVTDPLTGARNRRYLLQKMEQEAIRVRRSTRESDDIVFLLVDIDRFKYVNDRFGHATGDHILKQFHRVLASAVRETDTIVRWGGEEFLIVARRISRSEATVLADRVLRMVRDMRFESSESARTLRLTCSVGFATFPFVTWDRSLFTWEQVVDIADHCLYAVKRSGRDGWVGLAAGPQLRSDSFLSRMRDDVAALAANDEVVVLTSFDDSKTLEWH